MINQAILAGNLGSDSVLKMTDGGRAVLRFSMATTRYWKDKGGQKKEKTAWHTVVVWGERGERLHRDLVKGALVTVVGEIEYRKHKDKDGVERYYTDIVASQVVVLSGEKAAKKEAQAEEVDDPGAPEDDFIPF